MKHKIIAITLLSLVGNLTLGHLTTAFASDSVQISNDFIVKRLTDASLDFRKTQLAVTKARDEVFVAKAKLIPSLSLAGLFEFNIPHFLLSAATCLVPFLFPSNWFGMIAAKHNLEVERLGAEISILNLYATVLSLVYQAKTDAASLSSLTALSDTFKAKFEADTLKHKNGIISEEILLKSELSYSGLGIRIREFDTVVKLELSRIKDILGIDPQKSIDFASDDILNNETAFGLDAIDFNYSTYRSKMLQHSLENEQTSTMIKSTEAERKATVYSFISGCSGTQGTTDSSGGGSLFQSFTAGASFEIGFGYLATNRIAKKDLTKTYLLREETESALDQALDLSMKKYSQSAESYKLSEEQLAMTARIAELDSRSPDNDQTATDQELVDATFKTSALESMKYGNAVSLSRMIMSGPFAELKKILDTKFPKVVRKK